MFKKKKGMMLLECIMYMAISAILGCILVKILISTDYIYLNSIKEHSNHSDVNDFFINLERFVHEEEVTKIEAGNNKIIIYKGTVEKNFEKEEIYMDDDKVIIKYYDVRNFEDYNARNTLILDVDDFMIRIKEKLVYVYVKKGGIEHIKCL